MPAVPTCYALIISRKYKVFKDIFSAMVANTDIGKTAIQKRAFPLRGNLSFIIEMFNTFDPLIILRYISAIRITSHMNLAYRKQVVQFCTYWKLNFCLSSRIFIACRAKAGVRGACHLKKTPKSSRYMSLSTEMMK